MSAVLERAGGPSLLHEDRVAALSAMATLARFDLPMTALPDGSIPDVLQLRRSDGGLFIGDAKASETPGNSATFGRLTHYSDFLAGWVGTRHVAVLALIVEAHDAYNWLRVLRDLCIKAADGQRVSGRVDLLDFDTAVVWHYFDRKDG